MFYFSVQAKAIQNVRKGNAAVAAGHRGKGNGTKLTDDEICGPKYYANQIQAIEATDVSMFQSAASVLFQ